MIKLLEAKVITDLLIQEEIKEFLELHQDTKPASSEIDDDGMVRFEFT